MVCKSNQDSTNVPHDRSLNNLIGAAGIPSLDDDGGNNRNSGKLEPKKPRKLFPSLPRFRIHTLDSLHYRNFRLLWLGTTFTNAGLQIQQLVVGWFTFELTNSYFFTSLVLGLLFLPFIIAGPIGGVIADRFDKQKTLVIISLLKGMLTAGFASLILFGGADKFNILIFPLMMGFFIAISDPSRVSLVPNLVPKQHMVNAFALKGLSFNGTRFAVPLIAGFLIHWLGPGVTLLIGSSIHLVATTIIMLIQIDYHNELGKPQAEPVGSLLASIKYIANEPKLLGILLLLSIPPFLLASFIQGLMPSFASEVFKVNAWGLGLIISSLGFGGTFGSLLIATVGDTRHKGKVLFITLSIGIVGSAIFSQSTTLILAIPVLIIMFAGIGAFFALATATVQILVPTAEIRGRMTALMLMVICLWPVGATLAGFLATMFNPSTAVLIGACTATLILSAVVIRFPQLRDTSEEYPELP